MKLSCQKNELLNAINTVQKAVPSKTTHQMLSGILLDADKVLKLTGNNLEMGIECIVEAQIHKGGKIVIDSRLFGDIVRKLPNSTINIEKDKNENIIILCGNSRFEIKGTEAEEYPEIPKVENKNSLKVSQIIAKDMIRQTLFSVGTDENRPVLMGVNIESKNGLLIFVAIDGFRLALRKCTIEDVDADINVIVPGKTLSEIGKILQLSNEDLNIYASENQIMFDMGNTKIVSRLIEGEFFNYENVIPKEYETRIVVDTKDFLNCIDRASVLISSDGTHYPVNISLQYDEMVITSNTNMGKAREEFPIEIEGSDIEVRYNPKYFLEALKEIDEDIIDVSFNSDVGPCIIKSVDKDTFVYMLLPLRK